jgi:hypothetical protein
VFSDANVNVLSIVVFFIMNFSFLDMFLFLKQNMLWHNVCFLAFLFFLVSVSGDRYLN